MKEYNQYHQYAETLPVYRDFYDSISSTYSKKTKKNNDDRLRKAEADRARKMALLEEDYQRNRNYVNMQSCTARAIFVAPSDFNNIR